MRMSVTLIKNNIPTAIKKRQQALHALPQQTLQEFVQNTPKKTGNARSKTKLVGNSTINAGYPYARRLDNGYSKQSPRGMIKPTKEWLIRKLKQIMRMR